MVVGVVESLGVIEGCCAGSQYNYLWYSYSNLQQVHKNHMDRFRIRCRTQYVPAVATDRDQINASVNRKQQMTMRDQVHRTEDGSRNAHNCLEHRNFLMKKRIQNARNRIKTEVRDEETYRNQSLSSNAADNRQNINLFCTSSGLKKYLEARAKQTSQHRFAQKSKSPPLIVFKQDINFVPVDPNRVSRYTKPSDVHVLSPRAGKWSQSVERYMQSRTKMSDFFKTTKDSGEFGSLSLDRRNTIIQKRKIEEIRQETKKINVGVFRGSCSERRREGQNAGEFVSHLYPSCRNFVNKAIKQQSNPQRDENNNESKQLSLNIKRRDVLLVNFVSTYFRRKFFSKRQRSRKMKLSSNRCRTVDNDDMIAFQGQAIDNKAIQQILQSQAEQLQRSLEYSRSLAAKKQATNRSEIKYSAVSFNPAKYRTLTQSNETPMKHIQLPRSLKERQNKKIPQRQQTQLDKNQQQGFDK